ncbi:class II holin [Escherichia phage P1723]|uniref:Class II holin n=1 Tax=Escherichia phage P1723 TaxID=2736274 RepID=A0A6M9QBG7_9CAUD|nr:class II holin [Escherichia phage P1723]
MMSLDFNNGTITIPAAAAGDVALRTFWGLSLNEWFYVAAIVYTLVQIGSKMFDKWLEYKKMELGGRNE